MSAAVVLEHTLARVDRLMHALRSRSAEKVDAACDEVFGPAGAAVLAQLTPGQAQRLCMALRAHRRDRAEAVLAGGAAAGESMR